MMIERTSPDFETLPLEEVSVRFAPNAYLPIGASVLKELMLGLEAEWPVVDFIHHERSGFGRACLKLPLQYAFGVLGLRFKNPDSGLRLIYQANLLRIDWERKFSSVPYPRFPGLLALAESTFERIRDILEGDVLSFHACNLSYQNFVRTASFPVGSDVSAYIRKNYRIAALDPESVLHEQNICWKEPSGIDYRLHLKTIAEEGETADEDLVGLQITTTAGKVFEGRPGLPTAETRELNSLLNSNFLKILTPNAKKEWGLVR